MNAAETLHVKLMGDTSHYTNSLKHAAKATQDFQKLIAQVGVVQAAAGQKQFAYDKTHNLLMQQRSKIAFSLAEQKRRELAKPTSLSILGGGISSLLGGGVSLLGKGLAAALTGIISGSVTAVLTTSINGVVSLFKLGATAAWNLASSVFSLGAEFEKTAVSFEIMTGSAEKGKQVLDDLRKVAISSPYTFRQLSSPTQMLLGMGVAADDVIATVSRLGDVAAGNSERMNRLALAYGQVMAAGRFMGTELRQFTEAGVGIADFAQTMNVSSAKFREMMTRGLIGPDVVIRTLERITSAGGRFANMNQRINKTVGGSYNALIETIEMGLGKAGIAMFSSSGLAVGIQSLARMFREQIPLIEQWGTQFGKFLAPIVSNFQSILDFGGQLGTRVLKGIFGDFSVGENAVEKFSKIAITSFLRIEKAIALMFGRLEQFRQFAIDNMMVRGVDNLIENNALADEGVIGNQKAKLDKQARIAKLRDINDANRRNGNFDPAREAANQKWINIYQKEIDEIDKKLPVKWGGKKKDENKLEGGPRDEVLGPLNEQMANLRKLRADEDAIYKKESDYWDTMDPSKAANAIDRAWRRMRRKESNLILQASVDRMKKLDSQMAEVDKEIAKENHRRASPSAVNAKRLQDEIDAIKAMDPAAIAELMMGQNKTKGLIGGGIDGLTNIIGKPLTHMLGQAFLPMLGNGMFGRVLGTKVKEWTEEVQNELLRHELSVQLKFEPTGDMKKFIDSLQGKIGGGTTDFEKTIMRGQGLNKYINDQYRFGPITPERENELTDLRKAGAMQLLDSKLKDRQQLGFPSSARIGSSESADIVNRSIASSKESTDIQGQIKDVLEEMKTEMEDYYKRQEIIDKEFQEWLKKEPKILKVKGV